MSDEPQDTAATDLTDELAKKYDPERLLRIMQRRAGRGDPLEHSVRQRYERRYGVDLGHVRVFTGEFAEQFNKQRSAYAVTVGATGMILMGGSADKSPVSASGEALLGHELAHVAQQSRHAGGGLHRKATAAGAMPFAEEHEAEAEAHEQSILQEQQAGNIPIAAGSPGANDAVAQRNAADQLKQNIESVRERVIELLGETARVREMRIGASRRA
ncbi:MAG TPA: DUF4157 domain-containing protein [Kofleriaceae bacterium]